MLFLSSSCTFPSHLSLAVLQGIHFSILLGLSLVPRFSRIDGATHVVVIGSAFRASGGRLSGPGVYLSFNIFSALLISAFEGGFVLTLNNISAIGMFGLSADGSLLRISLKCSSHLDLCSTSLFMVLPSLSFAGFEGFLLFPASCYILEFLHVSSVHCHFSLCC